MKLGIGAVVILLATAAIAGEGQWPTLGPAARVPNAEVAPILAAARAGPRAVAVGDHGVVLLSDDGASFRQAASVPVGSMLTTVQFIDDQHGFAAGHDGVVLQTRDGGDTWTLLRATPGIERPVLSLHFDTAQHGLAVGLYGWAIETRDGGRTWSERHIGAEDDDRHLFHVFTSPKGTWLIAGEAGTVFRSTDAGASWQAIDTGNPGSFWHGLALADGTLLVSGMRGHVYRSTDDGRSWHAIESGTTQSLTGAAQLSDGSVAIVGMNGVVLRSTDRGATFVLEQRTQGEPLTAVLADGAKPLLLSMFGPLPGTKAP